ncbi:Protein of unknown function (DUF2975) [Chitinophaga skermanii]|uniref:DUF2975 family protein n=1 Tax=Chitinophaga skermanii TaxID=331697 RepID=A0A327QUR2_9BACT|nr:DUF2975 domain-containing protein [Chitinophaga skermanii]RAJ05467.1 Protein of unknown function (DUF2975) [Chitinophaga skermanii]
MKTSSISPTRTQQLLKVMYVCAWIIFVGLSIEAGSVVVSGVVGYYKPEMVGKMYKPVDLTALKGFSDWYYIGMISLLIGYSIFKAHIAYMMIKVLESVKLESPFTKKIVKLLEGISYTFLTIAIIVAVYNGTGEWMFKHAGINDKPQLPTEQFLVLAGLVFILSQIFKRGVEIQAENDLTV